ncbi:Delta-2 dienoyl-CoA isomerase [Mycena indigotica]|uniref:Delta-2 dienoyl-CoA isomerase n=1 Tax=Mycena indigotica TaxID=2126181 RepID=A0A8H6W6G1_9AGAR|nr:Delta-2 dienoyl-CoA isomerase [Mycena indigotica]KAF7301029.1 Delta-2 dienoyl-CoA isomerase [Mycena indigotica]
MGLAADLSSQWIKVSEPIPHVLHVELSRKPVNAFPAEYWQAYGALFTRLAREGRDVRAAVVSSALPKLFTAGIDFASAADITQGGLSGVQQVDDARASLSLHGDIQEYQRAIGSPQLCHFPVIIAVHGLVLGLGVDFVSACDIRYAAETAQFSIKEVDIGLAADVGSLSFLPKVVGNHSMLHELAYSAKMFNAEDALRMGLISRVVPGGRDEVIHAALELAGIIATKSPIAVSGTKRILIHSRDHSVPENLDYVAAWNAAALRTQDIPEGLRASQEKRRASFAPLRKPTSKL